MNYYVDKMGEVQTKYKGKFKNIIELMKVEVEKAQTLREDLKIDTLNFLVEETKKEVEQLKQKYFEECKKVLQENMPIPKATNYTELDLRLLKLNMLANADKDNINKLKEILNEEDFNINKGQLLEIALLKNDSDLVNKISNIEVLKEENLKQNGRALLNNQSYNSNFIPGIELSEQLAMREEGLENYINRVAGVQTEEVNLFL